MALMDLKSNLSWYGKAPNANYINDIQAEDASLIGQLYLVAAKLAKQEGFSESGYRVVMNCNDDGGQTVYHIHLHMLAGKEMGWPPYTNNKKVLT